MKRIVSLLMASVMLLGMCTFCSFVSGQGNGATEFPFGDVPASRWSNPYVVLLQREGIVGGKKENVFAPADNIKRSEFVKMLAGVVEADTNGATHAFTDVVSGAWYEPYVAWAASEGIVNGVAEGKFAPDALVTRQDMATMIYRFATLVLYPEVEELPSDPDSSESAEDEDPSDLPAPTEPGAPQGPTYVLSTELLPTPEVMSDEPESAPGSTETADPTESSESEMPSDPGESKGLPIVNEAIAFSDDGEIAEYAKDAVSAMQQAGIIGGVTNGDDTFRFEPKNKATREQSAKMLAMLYLIINEDKELPEPVKPKAYTIKYVIDSGEISGAPTEYYTGEGTKVPNPTRKNYTFLGWTGTGLGKPVKNLVLNAPIAGDLTLTAKWTPTKYKITYKLGGGKAPGAKSEYTFKDSFTLPTPTRAGYEFLGWSGTGVSGIQKTVKVSAGSTGARTYTANWKAIKYKITYNMDGGTLWLPVTSYTADSKTIVVNDPEKLGFQFVGWIGTGLDKPTKKLKIPAGSTGNRVYTAVWREVNKQAVAQVYLFDWIEANKTYTVGVDSGVRINFKDGGKDYSFTMLARMPGDDYGRPGSIEVVLNTTVYLDNERWDITLKLYPLSDPIYGLTLTDLSTGKVAYSYEKKLYFYSDGSMQFTTTHDHAHEFGEECNYRCSYGYRIDLEKKLAVELGRIVQQVNRIFWYEIGVYGYDLTLYGFGRPWL